jgi:succinate dehydrogenase/fumarate reductase cytochrome b subunit
MAGIRHMLADIGMGEEINQARISAIILLVLTVLTTVILGVWIW